MNYKRKGILKDQKNTADLEKGKSLASAILVNQLHNKTTQNSPPPEEIQRSRQHFQEFRKYYHGRLMNKNQISNRCPDKKPVMLRAPLRTVKTVSIEVPLFAKSAIYKPSFNRSTQRSEHPKKCEEKEEKIYTPIKDAINQTEKIKLKNSDEELKVDTQTSKKRKPKIIVHKPPVDKNKHSLVSTLTKLNRRIQNLQEKYFNEPKPKYKSIYDIDETKMKRNIHTIYENTDFSKEEKSSYCFEKEHRESTKTYVLKKTEGTVFKINSDETYLNIGNKDCNIKEELPSEEREIQVNSSSVDVILSPTRRKDCRKKVSLFSVIEPIETIEPESLDSISGVPGLEESILKSDYLMKEFDVNSKRLNFDLSKIRNNVDRAAKKSVRFNIDPERMYSQKQMEDSINRQLEHSFFQMKLK